MALAAAIVAIAIVVLHGLVAGVPWRQVKADIAGYGGFSLSAAIAFTALSFLALSMYDVLAVGIAAPGKVPRHVAVMAGASGFAISNLLGFSWLTGGTLRFRIYSALGLDWPVIASVIAALWFSMWLGIIVMVGGLMALHPIGLTSTLGMSPLLETVAGTAILFAVALFFWWLSRGRQSVSLLGIRLNLPSARLALGQTAIAIVDLLGASLALYVLLPADLASNFVLFFFVYVSALALGILSHAPGGIGVFESVMIAGLGAGGRSDVLAALTLYRLIYYLLPFILAVVPIAIVFVAARRRHAGRIVKALYAVARPLVAPIVAGIALLCGVILLVSGNLPAETARLHILRSLLPLPFIEASHLVGSIVGVLLIVIARGLYRKQRRAWVAPSPMPTFPITPASGGISPGRAMHHASCAPRSPWPLYSVQ